MNELPERHMPVAAHVRGAPVLTESGPVLAAVDRMLERVVPILVVLVVVAVVVGGVFAVLSLLADQPAACVTEMTDLGQSACVRQR